VAVRPAAIRRSSFPELANERDAVTWGRPSCRPRNSFCAFSVSQDYAEQRQTGSHLILKHISRRMLVVPEHKGDLPRGLFF